MFEPAVSNKPCQQKSDDNQLCVFALASMAFAFALAFHLFNVSLQLSV